MTTNFFDLRDRKVWLFGGAGYLGSRICRALDEAGARVLCLDVDGRAARMIEEEGLERARGEDFDLFAGDGVDEALADRVRIHGTPDAVVNLAMRGSHSSTLEEATPDQLNATFAANQTAAIQLGRFFGQRMEDAADAPYCAFTDVAQTASGELLVVYSAGDNHLDAGLRIEMRRSTDQGRTWSEPAVIVDPIHSGHGVRDPHLARLRDGRVVLSYFEYPVKGDSTSLRSWARTSDDEGRTWSDPTALAADSLSGVATCNHAIELPDGRLLISIHGGDIEDEDGEILGVVASRDRGATWGDFVELHREPSRQGMECELALLSDGSLIALVRRTWKQLGLRIESADGGRTWSAPEAVPVGHAPGILVDDGIMLINHRTFPDGRARENTTGEARGNYQGKCTVVSLSLDAGRSFVAHLPLGQPVRNDFGGDTAYGGIVKLPDGEYFTTYYTTVPGGTAVFGQRVAVRGPRT